MHHLIAIGYGGTTLSLDENCQGTVVVLCAHSDLFEGHAPHDLDAKPQSFVIFVKRSAAKFWTVR